VQTFTGGGVVTQTISWQVASGATLDLGTYVLTGGGTFTLQSGAGLVIGSPAGISASSASGNVQTSGSRSFNTGADYTYDGATAQVTGTGLPANVRHLAIDNAAGVTLTNNLTVNGSLSLANGALGVGIRTLTLNGPVSASAGSIVSAATERCSTTRPPPGRTWWRELRPSHLRQPGQDARRDRTIGVAGTFTPGSAAGHAVAGSTIEFNGAGAQVVPPFTYHHLASSGPPAAPCRPAAWFASPARSRRAPIPGSSPQHRGLRR